MSSDHGGAPLGIAVAQAYGEFRFTPDRTNAIILISGATTYCGEDPMVAVARNAEVGQKLPIYVVGVAVPGEAQREVLTRIAEETGGAYTEATSVSELVGALAEFVDQIRS
jgi:hypothetical protein